MINTVNTELEKIMDKVLEELEKLDKGQWIVDGIYGEHYAIVYLNRTKFLINTAGQFRADDEEIQLTKAQREVVRNLMTILKAPFVNKETDCEKSTRERREALIEKIKQIAEK